MRISRKLGLNACRGGISAIPSYTGEYSVYGDLKSGRMELYTSGVLSFAGKSKIDVFAVGGGSSGLRGALLSLVEEGVSTCSGGGGGQGGYTQTGAFTVSGDIDVTIGAGGEACSSYATPNPGGRTSFGTLLTAAGGSKTGGGSGGGDGSVAGGEGQRQGGDGASDGESSETGGKGQGRTTRAFAETGGTLYAGGGGGGGSRHSADASMVKTPGVGGDGGGADGSVYNAVGNDAAPNTGGGGGGGGCDYVTRKYYSGGAGGSGIVIIRWG